MNIGRMSRLSAATLTVALALGAGACGGSPKYDAAVPTSPGVASESGGAPSAPPEPGAVSARDAAPSQAAVAEEPSRPGLGTEWGETRHSKISSVTFHRANAGTPFSVASLFYNDSEGSRTMATSSGFTRMSSGLVPVAGGLLQIGLKDESGSFLTGFVGGDKHHIVGEAGKRYSIVVKNRTDQRFELILSVDGLDVLDGKTASFSKRGYLVDPFGELEVDGFRQSADAVAAFRFGSVRESYAQKKHGDARNVGVIGLAVFHERGSDPSTFRTRDDAIKRQNANPFPGSFATPP